MSLHTTSSSETTEESPLLLSQTLTSGAENDGNYYFLSKQSSLNIIPSRKNDEGEVIEKLPRGTTEDEFASRPIMMTGKTKGTSKTSSKHQNGILSMLLGGKSKKFEPNPNANATIKAIRRNRQAAIKIEPKIFFSNERTFLAWLHCSVLLAGASIAITSLSVDNFLSQLYGIILLPIAIAFMCYAMHQYGKRSQLIRRRQPGPYEDIIGPSVLAVALILSIVTQFSVKLYTILA